MRFVLDGAPVRGTLVAEVVEAVGGAVVAGFTDGPSAGFPPSPAMRYGEGEAWYVTTMPDAAGLDALVGAVVEASGVRRSSRVCPPAWRWPAAATS